ncbi:TlpA disulfide reductase family protein [Pedobacter sp. Hv1]|uniref:TlpA disulfide reductase family protein n=1 Tax=Pedobacter sp. Hv1 TaxID=1740090 RepID=UPI0006D8A4A6|nr:TlpA disulfide reductase family protein [Pedobacter sp. Hv1]KQC01342.1 hypothetical protein AQF98_06405 [Pedobacter sp. Hv1]
MKLSKTIILLLFLFSVEIKAQEVAHSLAKEKPLITGFVHGFKNGSRLYLIELTNMGRGKQRMVDSAMVMNERFQLTDRNPSTEKPRYYFLYNSNASDYVYFWIDDQPITFSGQKGNFRNSLINGSVTQQMQEVFTRTVLPFYNKRDSLKQNHGDEDSMKQLLAELKLAEISFIEKNPSSFISTYVLSGNCKTWGLKTTKELYQKLSPENKENSFGMDVKKYIDLNKEIGIGSLFVDFEQPTNDGKTARLSSLKSKYVLLEFWASNCGPCRRENPEMVKLYQNYKSRGFEILEYR